MPCMLLGTRQKKISRKFIVPDEVELGFNFLSSPRRFTRSVISKGVWDCNWLSDNDITELSIIFSMNLVLKKNLRSAGQESEAVSSFREQIQDGQEQHRFLVSLSYLWPWHMAPGGGRTFSLCLFRWGPERWQGEQTDPWWSSPWFGCRGHGLSVLGLTCLTALAHSSGGTALCCDEKPQVSLSRRSCRPTTSALRRDTRHPQSSVPEHWHHHHPAVKMEQPPPPSSLAVLLARWYAQEVYDSCMGLASPWQMLAWCRHHQAGKNVLRSVSLFKQSWYQEVLAHLVAI